MTTTNGNRPILDLPRWELLASSTALTQSFGTDWNFYNPRDVRQSAIFWQQPSLILEYSARNDSMAVAWNPGANGFSNGSFICGVNVGPSNLCSANGTSTTLITQENLQRNLNGYKVMITEGPAAGDVREIEYNTVGANATIKVTSSFSASPTTSTRYRLMTPRYYFGSGGSTSTNSFRYYDYATDTLATLANLPASFSTVTMAETTPSLVWGEMVSFATGTATGGTANTISNSGKAWATNQWANSQIRLTGGTGAGQIRTISSNTGTAITVSANWTTTPDNTTTYAIEGNDDFIYVLNSGSTTLRKYTISTNTWSTLAATTQAIGDGLTMDWVFEVNNPQWTDENAILNGRYLYAFRGGATRGLQRYDIAANSWAEHPYASDNGSTFGQSTCSIYAGNKIHLRLGGSPQMMEFDVFENNMVGAPSVPLAQPTQYRGRHLWVHRHIDGSTKIDYLYLHPMSTTNIVRRMIL